MQPRARPGARPTGGPRSRPQRAGAVAGPRSDAPARGTGPPGSRQGAGVRSSAPAHARGGASGARSPPSGRKHRSPRPRGCPAPCTRPLDRAPPGDEVRAGRVGNARRTCQNPRTAARASFHLAGAPGLGRPRSSSVTTRLALRCRSRLASASSVWAPAAGRGTLTYRTGLTRIPSPRRDRTRPPPSVLLQDRRAPPPRKPLPRSWPIAPQASRRPRASTRRRDGATRARPAVHRRLLRKAPARAHRHRVSRWSCPMTWVARLPAATASPT